MSVELGVSLISAMGIWYHLLNYPFKEMAFLLLYYIQLSYKSSIARKECYVQQNNTDITTMCIVFVCLLFCVYLVVTDKRTTISISPWGLLYFHPFFLTVILNVCIGCSAVLYMVGSFSHQINSFIHFHLHGNNVTAKDSQTTCLPPSPQQNTTAGVQLCQEKLTIA